MSNATETAPFTFEKITESCRASSAGENAPLCLGLNGFNLQPIELQNIYLQTH
jgi:hypothetical protein